MKDIPGAIGEAARDETEVSISKKREARAYDTGSI
jgi:hypothetical protein